MTKSVRSQQIETEITPLIQSLSPDADESFVDAMIRQTIQEMLNQIQPPQWVREYLLQQVGALC